VTGFLTVGLILALGGGWAFLLWAVGRDQGLVVGPNGWQRYLLALKAAAEAALRFEEAFAKMAKAIERASYGAFQLNERGYRIEFDQTPLLEDDLPDLP
jgi:hypothetical protein